MKGLGCGVVCGIAGIQSSPVIAVEAAVLDGFGEVLGGDGGGFIEVGDGAGNFEDAVVGAGGEAHASDGHFEGALAGIVESADFADIAGGHAGVVESAGALYGAGLLDAGADFGGRLGGGIAAQFLEGDGWDFDVDIDAIEEGTADLAEIVLDLAWGAAALAGRIAIEPALTRLAVLESEPEGPTATAPSRPGPRGRSRSLWSWSLMNPSGPTQWN